MGCIKVNITLKEKPIQVTMMVKKKPIGVTFTINRVLNSNNVNLIYGNSTPRLN